MKRFIFIFASCFILIKVTSAQVIRTRSSGRQPPGEIPEPKRILEPPPPSIYRAPKCYPETATAYFLPAPPSAPKVTILDPDWRDKSSNNYNFPEIPMPHNILPNQAIKEQPFNPSLVLPANYKYNFPESTVGLPPNIIFNRENIEPPCNPSLILPDLIDSMPLLIQNRFVRLVDSDDRGCETCSKLIEKLPIFNFDKELLDGFLAGLGINT